MDTLLAYADSTSYFPGDRVNLFINSPAKFGFAETIEFFKPNQNVKLEKTNIQGDLTLQCQINQSGSTPGIFITQKIDSQIVKIFWDISTSSSLFVVNPHIVDISGNKIYGVDFLSNVIESGTGFVTLQLPISVSQLKIFFLCRGKFIPGYSFELRNFYIFNVVNRNSIDSTIQLFDIDKKLVLQYTEPNSIDQEFIKDSFAQGCKWKSTSSFVLPQTLESGYYFIKVNYGSFFYVPIIIKSKNPESIPVLLLANSNTWNAYNAWAGPEGSMSAYSWVPSSTYSENLKYKTKDTSTFVSNRLSFNRPDSRLNSEIKNYMRNNINSVLFLSHLLYSELYLLLYLKQLGIKFSVICDMDLHKASESDIAKYSSVKLFGIQVHPEYWSELMIRNYNLIYSKMKTNLMYLGANGMYWKVVINMNDRVMEIRKDGSTHLLDGTPGGLYIKLSKAGYFKSKPNMLMIEDMLKIYYEHTYSRVSGKFNNPFVIKKPHSPIFNLVQGAATGLKICFINRNSDLISSGASGWEVDKSNILANAKYVIASNPDGLSDMVYVDDLPIKILSIGSITFTGSILYDINSYLIMENFFKLTGLIN